MSNSQIFEYVKHSSLLSNATHNIVYNLLNQVSYWREYTPTIFSHELCSEIGVGLYTGARSDMKIHKLNNIAHNTLFLSQFVFVYVCSWHKVYYSLAIIISLHLKIYLKK